MIKKTPESIILFGTEEPVQSAWQLSAGPITCDFDQGALRSIKIHGTEAIRNIAFVVRDKDWGTYSQILDKVQVEQTDAGFTVTFDAICKDNQQEIRYRANIIGTADGSLSFTADYSPGTDFLTNRTGFVVLHPINGVAGNPLTIEHTSGTIEHSVFPELIDPIQPFKDIRALTHEVVPGVQLSCRMLGDAFEMEDQRQWNDASYKTYVRPLSLPWPYTIPACKTQQQSVTLTTIETTPNTQPELPGTTTPTCIITISRTDTHDPMPRIGLGLEPQHLADTHAQLDLLKIAAPQQLAVWHEVEKQDCNHLKQAAVIARAINVEVELQVVIPDDDFRAEIQTLASRCCEAGLNLSAIHVAPAAYLKSIMPGPSWPDVTPLEHLYKEIRTQFPGVAIGGGMLSFFPELNRHAPSLTHLDFVSHASNTITHACDDATVTENLETLPHIIKTGRTIAGTKPYHVGPSSIGMRFNPYGSKTMGNPDNLRVAMTRLDPRQRGLINAAWTVGYAAHMIRGGITCINLHAPTGEFGIINSATDWARPGFDGTNKEVFPAYHAVKGLTDAAGQPKLQTHSSMSRELETFAFQQGDLAIIWIANLTEDPRTVEVKGVDCKKAKIATLSIDTFDACTDSCTAFDRTTVEINQPHLVLGPYSVIRLTALHS